MDNKKPISINIDLQNIDSIINEIDKTKTFEEAIDVIEQTLDVTFNNNEINDEINDEMKLMVTQILLIAIVKHITTTQQSLQIKENFELSLLYNSKYTTLN